MPKGGVQICGINLLFIFVTWLFPKVCMHPTSYVLATPPPIGSAISVTRQPRINLLTMKNQDNVVRNV